jgi:hypothetical protein
MSATQKPQQFFAPSVAVKPVERDRMPYPVATNLLSEPKGKLSNRMRKNCHAARDIELPSTIPITYDEAHNPITVRGHDVVKEEDRKLNARMRKATSPQLAKWIKRCVQRRRNAQDKYLKLKDRVGPAFDKARRLLEIYVQGLDRLHDSASDALGMRLKHYHINNSPANHIQPRAKRNRILNCRAA